MLYHDSSRPYEAAASEAATAAKQRLEDMIENGKTSGAQVIQKVMTEVPTDQIVRGRALSFYGETDHRDNEIPSGILAAIPKASTPGGSSSSLLEEMLDDSEERMRVHQHALTQICQKVGFPWRYAQALRAQEVEDWGVPLLAHNLNELYHNQAKRYLIRSFEGEIRGFLSDRYRRLDSRPLVEAFAEACQKIGAVAIQGYATDTKVALKAMLPVVFEPAPNEVIAFYVYWGNSDYGNGAHELKVGILRLWCTNYAIMDDVLRQVHLGRRLSDDISWSNRTYDLDTKAMASAIDDMVSQSLSEEKTTELCSVVKTAHEEKIDPAKALAKFKKDLTKGEMKRVAETFNSPDVENLPPGNSVWRLSNAISWVAGKTEDTERKIDLMKVAGKALTWIQG